LSFAETVAAVHRAVTTGSEWNLSRCATFGTYYVKHFPIAGPTAALRFPSSPAIGATTRNVLKAFLGIEFLFTNGEYEFSSTFLTGNNFVFKTHSKDSFQIKLLQLTRFNFT
jgi:hypothetical protein